MGALCGLLLATAVPAAPAWAASSGPRPQTALTHYPSRTAPGAKSAQKAKGLRKPAKKGPSGPPAVDVLLLKEVAAEEDQLVSLAVIPEARSFVQQAQRLQGRAQEVVDLDTISWDSARAEEVRALDRQIDAQSQVKLFATALAQLGLAEYTGMSSSPSGDLAVQEAELDQAELASVAATDTTDDLVRQQHDLMLDRGRVAEARAEVASSLSTLGTAQGALQRADAQVLVSQKDVVVALQWATRTGSAPLSPVEALVKLEGPLGRSKAARVRAEELAALATTTTTAPTAATASAASTSPASASPDRSTAPASTAGAQGAGGPARGAAPARALPGAGTMTANGPSILGPSLLSGAEVEGWFESTGSLAHVTVPMPQLVADYMAAGQLTGVRADIAFAQSVVETGRFNFPAHGQLTPKYNNFAGIGACDSCKHGWKFPSALAGVLAQERLLEGYATPLSAQVGLTSLASPGVRGCCTTWLGLSGVWATNPNYGYEILAIYEEMLAWAIPQQLQAAGLLSPTEYAAEGLAQVAVGASALTEAAASAGTAAIKYGAESTLGGAAAVVASGAWGVGQAVVALQVVVPAGNAAAQAGTALRTRG